MTDNKQNVNWSRFGLDPIARNQSSPVIPYEPSDSSAPENTAYVSPNVKDLFDEDQVRLALTTRRKRMDVVSFKVISSAAVSLSGSIMAVNRYGRCGRLSS